MEADGLVDGIDTNLIKRCKNSEEAALNTLLRRYEGYLYRICYSFTRNREDSLDMMQEVYIKVLRGLQSFDETRPLLPWLRKIAINTMINHVNRKRVYETSLNSGWDQEGGGLSPEEYLPGKKDTEAPVVISDMRAVIDRLIAQLPESYRMALTLRYHEQMSYKQIAEVLDQPLGTVKNSIFRARSLLRKMMLACDLLEV
ncbi:MAG: RNA polymerase sigma factor [Bacillota bacterium]